MKCGLNLKSMIKKEEVFCKKCKYLANLDNDYCKYNHQIGGYSNCSQNIWTNERNSNNNCEYFKEKEPVIKDITKFKNKVKSMRKRIIGFSILGVVVFFVFIFASGVFAFRNTAVNMEETIKAQYSRNQNNYDNMWKKFKEMAQVPEQYTADLKELYETAIGARYGENGSQAMFQWLKEQNPQLDATIYSNLQMAIDAGRNKFESDQKELIAQKEQYAKILRTNKGIVYNIVWHFPKIDLDEYAIVTSEQTEETFKAKKAGELNLFD